MNRRPLQLLAPLAAAALASACAGTGVGDAAAGGGGSDGTSEKGLTLHTRFILEGAADDVERIQVDAVTLHIGAIFVEPIGDAADQVAFANRRPFALDFDVDGGDTEIAGPDMELPFGGRFAVSLQLEPDHEVAKALGDEADDGSLVVSGTWTRDIGVDGSLADTEPSPLPWRPEAKSISEMRLQEELPFVYSTDRAVRLYLSDVTLADEGHYELVLTLHVGEWLEDSVIPALESASRESDRFRIAFRGDEAPASVDLGHVLDDEGVGVDALAGDIGVSARAVPKD